LEKVFSGAEPVGLPWQTLPHLFGLVTNPRLPGFRRSAEEALRVVDEWLEQPNVRVLVSGDQHCRCFGDDRRGQASGPLVSDAQLAALTIEYGRALHNRS